MSTQHNAVKVESVDSGQLKVVIPHPYPDRDKNVSVGVSGSSQESTIVVSQELPQPERRQQPPPTQVIMQAGGLSGKAATIANLSAVGFVMLLTFLMYSDFRSSVKDQNSYLREEMRTTREANERNIANLNTALNNMSITNTTVISELRSSRMVMESTNRALIEQLKTIREPKP